MIQATLNSILRDHRRLMGHAPSAGQFRQNNVFCVAANGQKIRFAPHESVELSYLLVLENFLSLWDQAKNPEEIAYALAYFWLAHVAIHPFADGNGRVGKSFLKARLAEKGILTMDQKALDAILLRGQTEQDLINLTEYFMTQLKITETI